MKLSHLFVLMVILSSLKMLVVGKPLVGLGLIAIPWLGFLVEMFNPKPPIIKKDVINEQEKLEEKIATIVQLIEEGIFLIHDISF